MELSSRQLSLRKQNKTRAEKLTGLKLDFINENNINYETLRYEEGKKYYVGYWQIIDETLNANDGKVIDFLICSHFDQDHTSGIKEILTVYKVKELYMNRPWLYVDDIFDKVIMMGELQRRA